MSAMEASSNDQNDDQLKSFFVNSQGLKIHCEYWYPKLNDGEQLRAAVFICHGAGEHCRFYSEIAARLNEHKILAFAHDHVGHGLSEGERMYITDFSYYCDDVVEHVNSVKQTHRDIPFFVIGHSMGGAIAVKVVLDNVNIFAGMALIAPCLIISPRSLSTSTVFSFFARTVARVFPRLPFAGMDQNVMSHDPQAVQRYLDDPLVHQGKVKTKWLVTFNDTTTSLRSRLAELTCPFFVLQGTDDRICDPAGAQMLHDNAASVHKKIKLFPGAYHQLHNESDGRGEEVVSDVVQWINSCVSS